MSSKNLVFLGGTCANNNWRDLFLANMEKAGIPRDNFFNPVVPDWNEEAQEKEEEAKKNATLLMFYLGSPYQEGNPLSAYSMVEAAMCLYDNQEKSVIVFDPTNIQGNALKSYKQTEKVLRQRFPNANIFATLQEACDWFAEAMKPDSIYNQRTMIHKKFYKHWSAQYQPSYEEISDNRITIWFWHSIMGSNVKAHIGANEQLVVEDC